MSSSHIYSSSRIYPPLPLHSKAKNEWPKMATERAGSRFCGPGEGIHGLAAALLGADLYKTTFTGADGVEPAPFVPPAQQAAEGPNVSNAESKHAYDQYEKKVNLHFRYTSQLRLLAEELAATLSQPDIRSLEHPQHGMLNVTAQEIFAHMKRKYGTPSVQALRDMQGALKTPYTPGEGATVDAYIEELKFKLRELATHGAVFSKQLMTSMLQENVTQCGIFADVLIIYDRTHATADKQDFDELGKILVAEEERKRTTATTGTTGFGNAATSSPRDQNEATFRQLFTDMMAQHSANAAVPIGGATTREADLQRANLDLTRQLARIQNREVKKCKCGTDFTSHNPDHDVCKACYIKDRGSKESSAQAKEKGRGGEKKKGRGGGESDEENNEQELTTKDYGSYSATRRFSSHSPAKTQHHICDSGASEHYISFDNQDLLKDIKPCKDGPVVLLPDNSSLKASHSAYLEIPSLPLAARKCWLLPGLKRSLIAVSKMCDAGLIVTFSADKVTIHGPGLDGPLLLTGARCRQTSLWTIPLSVGRDPPAAAQCDAMLSEHRSHHEAVDFLRATMFSPGTKALAEAVKRKYVNFPGVSAEHVRKYPPNSPATALGHLRGTAYKAPHLRHPDVEEDLEDFFPERLFTKRKLINEREQASVASMMVEIDHKTLHHVDATGRFPVTSRNGSEYLLVFYCEYANYTHFEMMRNRTSGEYVSAYRRAHDFFLKHGIRADHIRLDNECSGELRDFFKEQTPPIKAEFVPPSVHRANKAERQIGIGKNHFIAGISTTDPSFPLEAWEDLVPQLEISLNLLRQSGISHFMSAYQQLRGPFDFHATPMAPPGTRVVVYDHPDARGSFANRGTHGYYVGPAMEHMGCFTTYIPSTRKTRITNTLAWFPPAGWTLPGASPNDVTNGLLDALEVHIRKHGPTAFATEPQPMPPPASLLATFLDYARRTLGVEEVGSNVPRQRVTPFPPLPPPPALRPTAAQAAEDEAAIAALEASEELARQLELVEKEIAARETAQRKDAHDASETLARQLESEEKESAKKADGELAAADKASPPEGTWETAGATAESAPTTQQATPPVTAQTKGSEQITSPAASKKSKKHPVGTRFRKTFDKGTYLGQVVQIGPKVKGGTKRRVIYSDGDKEDLFVWEIDGHIKKHGAVTAAVNATIRRTFKQLKALAVSVPVDRMSLCEIAAIVAGADMRPGEKASGDNRRSKKAKRLANLANAVAQPIAGVKPADEQTIAVIDRYGLGTAKLEQVHDLDFAGVRWQDFDTIRNRGWAGAAIPTGGVAPLTYKSATTGPDKELWAIADSIEFDKLLRDKSEAVMKAIRRDEVPAGRVVSYYNPQVKVKDGPGGLLRRVRGTYGGNISDFEGDISANVAELTTVKCLLNKVVSDDRYSLGCADIVDYYLGSPLARPEYMFARRDQIPNDIMKKYDLDKFLHNWNGVLCVVFEINKGIYGLPQAGRVAQIRLNAHLEKHGYIQTDTPCLYKHISRETYFTLIVDDFLVATVCDADRDHFLETLKALYKIKFDPDARKYIGITITQDKVKHTIKLSVPGYVENALRRFGIQPQKRRTDAPAPFTAPRYYDRRQQMATVDDTKPLGPKETKFIQEVVGVFGWYARAVDSTILCAVNKLGSRQARPTEAVLRDAIQLLHYVATWPDATTVFHPSDMQLACQSDASYLSETESRSRAAAILYLVRRDKLGNPDAINGAIDCFSTIIKAVVASAGEAEYFALYLAGTTAEALRNTLRDLGHPQGATPIISDNACAVGIANRTVKQRRSKAFDMRTHWIRCRSDQGHFKISWAAGTRNLADFFTKSHPTRHHLAMRSLYVEN